MTDVIANGWHLYRMDGEALGPAIRHGEVMDLPGPALEVSVIGAEAPARAKGTGSVRLRNRSTGLAFTAAPSFIGARFIHENGGHAYD